MAIELSVEEEVIFEALKAYRVPVQRNFMEGHLEDEDLDPTKAAEAIDSLIEKGLVAQDGDGKISVLV